MKKLLVIFSFLILFSCQEKEKTTPVPTSEGTRSFSEAIGYTSNRKVTLIPEARAQVSDWLAYATAQHEMETLSSETGTEIMAASKSLVQIMESLNNTIPDTLRSKPVLARATVLLTKAKVLHQLSNKKNKNADEVFQVAQDLINEFDNFKIQVNELFLKTPGDFELELDREFEESQDTLGRSDLPEPYRIDTSQR